MKRVCYCHTLQNTVTQSNSPSSRLHNGFIRSLHNYHEKYSQNCKFLGFCSDMVEASIHLEYNNWVISFGCFPTTKWSHIQGSKSPRIHYSNRSGNKPYLKTVVPILFRLCCQRFHPQKSGLVPESHTWEHCCYYC